MSWDELVASALVGTARRPSPALPPAASNSALDEVLGRIDRADPEGAVLAAGAALGLYRQAGWRPPVDTSPPLPPSPPEDRPHCSEAAAAHLDVMVGGRFRQVLGEWLGLVAAAGRLVPPDRLPALLDVASANPTLRPAALAVIGERGRWLAGLNPTWAWAGGSGSGADEAGTWATGSASARRLLLARTRATDPASARELLASTWATETPEDRAAFLAVLGAGLSLADEPFVEAALDDRRKEVRQAAAQLLWRLPESRLAARMAERARPLVRVSGTARKRVEAVLPSEVDKAMVRDGIVAKPPAGFGERAWWLHQLLAATPLRIWTDVLGRPPSTLVELAEPSVRQAWAVAAAGQRDREWAVALLDVDDVHVPALLDAVPHDRALRVAAERVARLGLTPEVLGLLDHCPPPWDEELSRAVVQRLATAVRQYARPDAAALAPRDRLVHLATRLDPSIAPAAAAALAEHAGSWSDVVALFVDLLTFRAEMREELLS